MLEEKMKFWTVARDVRAGGEEFASLGRWGDNLTRGLIQMGFSHKVK